jgi:hypothetical protein
MPEPEAKRISQRLEKDRESQLNGKKRHAHFSMIKRPVWSMM